MCVFPAAVNVDGCEAVLNRWYHIVGTYDGAVIRLFIDGALCGAVEVDNVVTGACLTTRSRGCQLPGSFLYRTVLHTAADLSAVSIEVMLYFPPCLPPCPDGHRTRLID